MWTFGAAGVWARWPRAENRHHGNHHFVRLDVYAAKILKNWNGKWVLRWTPPPYGFDEPHWELQQSSH